MDPAPSRLAAILAINQLVEEAGVHTPLREGVLGALGVAWTPAVYPLLGLAVQHLKATAV